MQFIGHNVKWYRQYKRLTQQEVSDLLSTTLGRIKTYEAESAIPPIEILINIAEWIGISIDALIKIKLSEKKYPLLKKESVKEKTLYAKLNDLEQRVYAIEKKLHK